ncbi:hypothetical protein PMIN06_012717 [Paraphaeosphaeria minitans]
MQPPPNGCTASRRPPASNPVAKPVGPDAQNPRHSSPASAPLRVGSACLQTSTPNKPMKTPVHGSQNKPFPMAWATSTFSASLRKIALPSMPLVDCATPPSCIFKGCQTM